MLSPDPTLRPALEALTGSRRTLVRLTMGHSIAETEITLHDAWRWPLLAESWPLVASYVLPHDGVVLRLLAEARAGGTLPPLEALYEVLRGRRQIVWTPPAITRTTEGVTLQILRPPWRLLSDVQNWRGQGSCLDLSLLLAGGLEAAGEAPLVVFLLDGSGFPEHALVGIWRDGGHRFRPLLRGAELKALVAEGLIRAVEATHLCADRERAFRDAQDHAKKQIAGATAVIAVDITALRPPHGRMTPYETSFDSTVLAAVAEAEIIASEMGSPLLETLHLFYGLWASGGSLSPALAKAAGCSCDEILLWSKAVMRTHSRPSPRGRTRGFERCLADARENARSLGASLVREEDLWWAVLGGASTSVDRVFKDRPGVKASLLDTLSSLCPPSRPDSYRA